MKSYTFEIRTTVVVSAPNVAQARKAAARAKVTNLTLRYSRGPHDRDFIETDARVAGTRVLFRGRRGA